MKFGSNWASEDVGKFCRGLSGGKLREVSFSKIVGIGGVRGWGRRKYD